MEVGIDNSPIETSLEELLSRRAVAALLRISARTLDRWHALNVGPPRVTLASGSVRYRARALAAWIDRLEGIGATDRRSDLLLPRPTQSGKCNRVHETVTSREDGNVLAALAEQARAAMSGRDWITIAELAALLHVSVRTIRRWEAAGEMPPRIRKGHKLVYMRSTLNMLHPARLGTPT